MRNLYINHEKRRKQEENGDVFINAPRLGIERFEIDSNLLDSWKPQSISLFKKLSLVFGTENSTNQVIWYSMIMV